MAEKETYIGNDWLGLEIVLVRSFGDSDHDGDVDHNDYAVFSSCLAGPETWPDPTPPDEPQECLDVFDFDADGDVDLNDFAAFQVAFTGL